MAEERKEIWPIRSCRKADLEAMREICIETSSLPLRNENDRRFLLLMYCDPYVFLSMENCFVAVDDRDRPVGYILSVPDTRRFLRGFKKEVMPEIRDLGFSYAVKAKANCAAAHLSAVLSPAHLHIDLTASIRRKGVGTELMKTLKAHLYENGVTSVQLTCGSNNKAAVSFYKSNGFKTLFRGFGACVMKSETELSPN